MSDIKFYKEPQVRLVGQPVTNFVGIREFLDEHDLEWPLFDNLYQDDEIANPPDGEFLPEMAGRNCYFSWDKKGAVTKKKTRNHEQYIKHIIEVGHGSVLEHTNLNFMIWGISRSLSHELVRHRQGVGISQLSQRYVGEDQIQFCIPPEIEKIRLSKPALFAKWQNHMYRSQILYKEIVEGLNDTYEEDVSKLEKRKRSRQSARSVLPNATQTSMFWTANIRTLRHVIEMRCHPAADLEIRALAMKLFNILEKTYPCFVHGMSIIDMPDGSQCIESEFRKV